MQLSDILSADRVDIHRRTNGAPPFNKDQAIHTLASLLARGGPNVADIEKVLVEREKLQSTGIGEGVAIPHGAMGELQNQLAALLIVPDGVDFAAIDGRAVNILFAVIGPKKATGEHLKTLARVSRLLRHQSFRDRLVASAEPKAVYALIADEEGNAR